MRMWMIGLLLVAFVIAVVLVFWQLQRLIRLDAKARNIAAPQIVGFLAAGTQNGIGLLAYLALRRTHALQVALDDPAQRSRLKVGTLAAFIVMAGIWVSLAVVLFGMR
ncbi:hypothetical protein [Lacticaseibacillus porcinae]|uniref:hypothetical protein n=1 Tax=Lacticaseibacillus porcinae TaxID=1123687 RepID=UPI000F76FBEE|nr:hypothetical protein [Lacticaseibacillus porcinae]